MSSKKTKAPKWKRRGSTPEHEVTASGTDAGAPLQLVENILSLALDLAKIVSEMYRPKNELRDISSTLSLQAEILLSKGLSKGLDSELEKELKSATSVDQNKSCN